MKALDTNVLVRFLIKDDVEQANIVIERFQQVELSKDLLFVPILVVLETIWVLESVYEVAREDVLSALRHLISMPILTFESQGAIRRFLIAAHEINVDLSDLLIAQAAEASGCERVLTLDKRALKAELFEPIHISIS